jgi:hypothetical protein
MKQPSCCYLFFTTVPITKLFAWGEGDSERHVPCDTTIVVILVVVVAVVACSSSSSTSADEDVHHPSARVRGLVYRLSVRALHVCEEWANSPTNLRVLMYCLSVRALLVVMIRKRFLQLYTCSSTCHACSEYWECLLQLLCIFSLFRQDYAKPKLGNTWDLSLNIPTVVTFKFIAHAMHVVSSVNACCTSDYCAFSLCSGKTMQNNKNLAALGQFIIS